jgi:uncharacterized paraquat-inducible protein A
MNEYSHYCKHCRKFAACTHNDPEKSCAHCPRCNSEMRLVHKAIHELKASMALSNGEIMKQEVIYV